MRILEWLRLLACQRWLRWRVNLTRDRWSPLRQPEPRQALGLLRGFIVEAERLGEEGVLHTCCAAAGLLHHQQGGFAESAAMFERALRLHEERSLVPLLGLNYLRLRRYDEAVATLIHATELDPGSSLSYNSLGVAYEEMGRYQEALLAYQHAIRLDPREAAFHANLGNALSLLDRDDEAIAAYQEAIAADPSYAAPHNNLAGLYVERGRYEDAARELRERIRLNPNSVFLPYALLGVVERLQGRPESADHFRQALAQWDAAWREYSFRPFAVLAARAVALLCIGSTEDAQRVLAQAVSEMLPGDKIDLTVYELLRAAPEPPDSIEQMMAMLKAADSERRSKSAPRANPQSII